MTNNAASVYGTNNGTIKIKTLSPDALLPQYADDGAAGMDLYAIQSETIYPDQTKLIKTGIAMQLPHGFEAQIRSRSGLALKHGIIVLNAPGTIDSNYRGEIGAILHNTFSVPFRVNKGDRIAQMVIGRAPQFKLEQVETLDESTRGDGGFGSTGIGEEMVYRTTQILNIRMDQAKDATSEEIDQILNPIKGVLCEEIDQKEIQKQIKTWFKLTGKDNLRDSIASTRQDFDTDESYAFRLKVIAQIKAQDEQKEAEFKADLCGSSEREDLTGLPMDYFKQSNDRFGTQFKLVQCQKLPIVVHAVQIPKDFQVKTLEGSIAYGNAGDYLMYGAKQEQYPCSKDVFEATYRILGEEDLQAADVNSIDSTSPGIITASQIIKLLEPLAGEIYTDLAEEWAACERFVCDGGGSDDPAYFQRVEDKQVHIEKFQKFLDSIMSPEQKLQLTKSLNG